MADLIQHDAIHGTLDVDGIFVDTEDNYPSRQRMRRLIIYHTYELWETPTHTPPSDSDHNTLGFSSLVWLVDITIVDRAVSGYVLQSAVISPSNIAAIFHEFAQHVRPETH